MTTIPGKRRRITPPPPTIPGDLLVSEILTRLPVTSLRRCTSVCRSWRAAVKDPAFTRRHLELSRARPPPPVILAISPMAGHDPDGDGEEEEDPVVITSIRATHCDGLVAVTAITARKDKAHVIVCNPATMESIAVPSRSPNTARWFTMVTSEVTAVGFDPSTRGGFVLCRFFYRVHGVYGDEHTQPLVVEYNDVGHEVLRLGSGSGGGGGGSGGWRLTENAPFAIDDSVSPVCVGGAVYWAALDPAGDDDVDDDVANNVLLRFALRHEAFAAFPLPPGVRSVGRRDCVAELAGELCLARARAAAAAGCFDVWVVAAAGDGSASRLPEWSLRWRVDLCRPVGSVAPLAVDAADGALMMSVDGEDVYRYDEKNGVVEKVEDDVVHHVSRIVRWSGRGGEDAVMTMGSCADADAQAQLVVMPYVESLVSIASIV